MGFSIISSRKGGKGIIKSIIDNVGEKGREMRGE